MTDNAPGTTDPKSSTDRTDAHELGGSGESLSSRMLRIMAAGLDGLITLYAAELCLIALTGGVSVGIVSLTGAAKPLLWLILLVPLRMTVGDRSWLVDLVRAAVDRVARTWALISPGIPPSVIDSAFAMLVVLAASVPAAFIANVVLEPARPPGFSLPFTSERFVGVFAAWDSGW
jgi:hypothetical protein